MSEFSASPERLILGALLGFAVLLFLIIKVKIQPFIAIMSSALIIGIAVGMPFSMITCLEQSFRYRAVLKLSRIRC